jgi:hypothetical protein
MKTRLALITVVFASLIMANPVGASQYSTFGNLNVGDCDYAALANLTIYHDPSAVITTKDVVSTWRTGVNVIGFGEATGFSGQRVASVQEINNAQLNAAIANGGVWAVVKITEGPHAYAVIGANARRVEVVTWGIAYWIPRSLFLHEVVQMLAVTWDNLGK